MSKRTTIKEAAQARGRTLAWLAARMRPPLSAAYMGRLASGAVPLDEWRARRIAGLLGCNLVEIAPFVAHHNREEAEAETQT